MPVRNLLNSLHHVRTSSLGPQTGGAKAPTSTASTAKVTTRDSFTPATADVNSFKNYLQDQGNTNSCGTTSLAMLMSFWSGTPGAYTHQKIDQSIRVLFDGPTAPTNIVSYLRDQGYRAEALNNATLADLKGYLDMGVPVEVLYDPSADPSDVYLHYVDVVGYTANPDGSIKSLKVADPGGGLINEIPLATFEKRWANLGIKNVDIGANNLMIVGLPKNAQVVGKDGKVRNTDDIALPKNGGNWGTKLKVVDVVADIANGIGKAVSGVVNFFKRLF